MKRDRVDSLDFRLLFDPKIRSTHANMCRVTHTITRCNTSAKKSYFLKQECKRFVQPTYCRTL